MSVREDVLTFLRDTPQFSQGADDPEVWLSGLLDHAVPMIEEAKGRTLRDAQERAWRGLANTRIGLILGPPGTGKTHLLAWLITGYILARKAAGLPCRVLVSAFTKNAIGNLIDSVQERTRKYGVDAFDVVYLGGSPAGGIDSDAHHIAWTSSKGLKEAAQALEQQHVVFGATVWSTYKLLCSGELPDSDGPTAPIFDLVCVDEASQMPLAHGLVLLGGICGTGRLLVAGDDKQLPPIRVSREIFVEGRNLGGSLYDFLKQENVAEFALDETFRLNAPLTAFPEKHFYPGNFRSADQGKCLELRDDWGNGLEDWESIALDPQWPVCVFVHDGPPAATRNPFEARLAARLADRLRRAATKNGKEVDADSFWQDHLAIVSPHRAHNHEIRNAISEDRDKAFVETVDRIQGRERDAVILSYCVADGEFALVEAPFIYGQERLNVATTRAGAKLIVLVSRQLLETVPSDQEVLNQAQLLREFVYSCREVDRLKLSDGKGRSIPVEVRVRGFSEGQILPTIEAASNDELDSSLEMTAEHQEVLDAVRDIASKNEKFGTAPYYQVAKHLARNDLLPLLVDLHHLGWINLEQRQRKNGDGHFWTARNFNEQRQVFNSNSDDLLDRLEDAIQTSRTGRLAPFYNQVRSRFAWMNRSGSDILWSKIQLLRDAGKITIGSANGSPTIDIVREEALSESIERKDLPELSDADFEVLNLLEEHEAGKINFGIFESWISPQTLADSGRFSRKEVSDAVIRLEANGYLMIAEDQRLRSRMAETAREMRYVKQRFAAQDADRRPYLVRSLKLELRDRKKPSRNIDLNAELTRLKELHSKDGNLKKALDGLGAMLSERWGTKKPTIAAFQARGLEKILSGWRGDGSQSIVIAADTGAGKTEAACLPMFAAAAADRLDGNDDCLAVIAYPRIRLAANQAQRLAGYLSAYAKIDGMPLLTLGMQTGEVLPRFSNFHSSYKDIGWEWIDVDNTLQFPLFACPECDSDLEMQIGAGEGHADRLFCQSCNWDFSGWIGSKEGMERTPPNFFLPTTDSLHRWLQDPRYGAIFGDKERGAGPRALLADEIHLYSHIHGAQVGHVLQRCAHRAAYNRGSPPVAIGMSATLGDPAKAWSRLSGRQGVKTISANSGEAEVNPRGREYFFFAQPEVESRGKDIAGAATTIQSVMCLAHGMRRRKGKQGGFRSLVFLDSIDKLRRMHSAFTDAEEGKELASLRTRLYPDDPTTGDPRRKCCGEPFGCDQFRDGECWFFAATDEDQQSCKGRLPIGAPLRVSNQPVSSAAGGRVDRLINESDIVFSTSSLEVGFDDPDITMVYQHYAPNNLASFIQRKGRGGRGIDDRPITGVTLSIYSPRDSWWFAQPHAMIEPEEFDVPINPNNHFVLRGQVMAAMLDFAARRAFHHEPTFDHHATPLGETGEEMAQYAQSLYGNDIWKRLGFTGPQEFWSAATGHTRGSLDGNSSSWCTKLEWIAAPLFSTINLPAVEVRTEDASKEEDIMLSLASFAPGNVTRRYHPFDGYWIEPCNGSAPWFTAEDYVKGSREAFGEDGDGVAVLLDQLPTEARAQLGDDIEPSIFRPNRVALTKLGNFKGADWVSDRIGVEKDGRFHIEKRKEYDPDRMIHHESHGALNGFPLIRSDHTKARQIELSKSYSWLDQVDTFTGDALGSRNSGLQLAKLYWGAESEVRVSKPGEEPGVFRQIFSDPKSGKPMLHGFRVRTEGIQLKLNSRAIDAFIASEVQRLKADEQTRRWHNSQFTRYLVEARSRAAGINGYEAQRAAELFVAAAGDPELRKRLKRLFKFWDASELGALLEEARSQTLSCHPLLSQSRVEKVAQSLDGPNFARMFEGILADVRDTNEFAGYMRSAVVHGLVQRLKQSFLIAGQGDERAVLSHAKLPLQFGAASEDVVTIAEIGEGGDGTARAFVDNISEAEKLWTEGFLERCPNAETDLIQRRFLEMRERHSDWLKIEREDKDALAVLASELGLKQPSDLPQSLLSIIFDSEEVGAERIAFYDLAREIHDVDQAVSKRAGRPASAWEVTTAAVSSAKSGESEWLSRLLGAYEKIDGANLDEGLSPDARLADQCYRLSARLCVDGCQACLHTGSDLMSDSQVTNSVSRQLLQRFLGA